MTIDSIERYFGDRKYREKQKQLTRIYFDKEEELDMLKEIIEYINDNKIVLYHDLMDEICETQEEWFNFLTFSRKGKGLLLDYLKSKNRKR